MWYTDVILFILVVQTSTSHHLRKKSVVLFSCPLGNVCYASPPNCLNDCNAALSISSDGDRITTYNVTMLSPLSYTAVLIKEQGSDKFDTAIICSFHASKGIVAAVNYPLPVITLGSVDTTRPEGHTDSTHTQCSTTIFGPPPPSSAKFKLISGRWQDLIVIDDKLAVDVVPAVENARILSTNKKLVFPSPKSPPVFRVSGQEIIYDSPNSQVHLQERPRFPAYEGEEYDDDNTGTDGDSDNYNDERDEEENDDDNYVAGEDHLTIHNEHDDEDEDEHNGEHFYENHYDHNGEHYYEHHVDHTGGHFYEHSDDHREEHDKDKDVAIEFSILISVIVALSSLFYYI